jgi:glutamate dehydrogenase
MLLSKAIKLVAAFDHRHIFIDPDPDPAASWKERRRLFKLPRSSWADYNARLLSKGGGIYPRTMKRIAISKEAAAALGVEAREFEPEALINAILKSPVDLLWFGGIGTYVKSSAEANTQVGDPANDAVRVSGDEVRAKVVGEGANLGVTQAGRIEFALAGGRINTDFIDNSAGVDCSDNEVNIKIALDAARRAGRLTQGRRNTLLAEMTNSVSALVLEDNRLQALALSIAQAGGANAVAAQTRLIETLEDVGGLDRRTEGLAAGDVLSRRAMEGQGLTRPELAVLLSNTKLVLQDAVERSNLPHDAAVEPLLLGDFPQEMRGPFSNRILNHQLRKQLVATVLANKVVNRMGLVHPFELAEEEGVALEQICSAFVSACALLGLDEVWHALDTGRMPETARLALFEQTALALRSHMADLLRAGGAMVPPSVFIAEVSAGVGQLGKHVDDLLETEARDHAERIAVELAGLGAPARQARMVARLFAMDGAIGLARLARDSGMAPTMLARAFVDIGARLGLDWAQSKAAVMNPSDPWERLLVAGLARDFQQMRLEFLHGVARRKAAKQDLLGFIDGWAAAHAEPVRQFRATIGRAQANPPVAPAMLAQIASQARSILKL